MIGGIEASLDYLHIETYSPYHFPPSLHHAIKIIFSPSPIQMVRGGKPCKNNARLRGVERGCYYEENTMRRPAVIYLDAILY